MIYIIYKENDSTGKQKDTISTWKGLNEICTDTIRNDRQNSEVLSEFGKNEDLSPLEYSSQNIIQVRLKSRNFRWNNDLI